MDKYGAYDKQGLYNPETEKDSCGVGFVANIRGERSYDILEQGLHILKSLKHRGAVGADSGTGDGAGILLQIPHEFLKKEVAKLNIDLPMQGDYAVCMVFLPREPNARLYCEGIFEKIVIEEQQKLLGWREVPVNESACGESARATRPVVAQVFIHRAAQKAEVFERKLLIIRKRVQKVINEAKKPYAESFYVCSFSTRTIVYKGQILGYKLGEFYKDLQDDSIKTSIVLVHERYSTNTFPSWKLAQPFRYLAHNGEINTIRGNVNWMNAREGVMQSQTFGDDFSKILPVIEPGGSDSAALDNALELFIANEHSMEASLMLLIPEAWQNNSNMSSEKKAFYEYTARFIEPWDGPSTIAFTDGIRIGVTVDRNALRPARYMLTKDDRVIMASETGVIDIPPEMIIKKGCLQPGRIVLIDTNLGRIISDEEIKASAYKKNPFKEWIERNRLTLTDINQSFAGKKMNFEDLHRNQLVFGFTEEELEKVIAYMAENGKEPIGSMGTDIPIAILSDQPQLLFNYFKQKFAQVTNPPIDYIRESTVVSLVQFMGNHGKLLDRFETEKDGKYIKLEHPILRNSELESIRSLYNDEFRSTTIPMVFQADYQGNGLKEALAYLCKRTEESVKLGYNIIILSDRNVDMYSAPIPSLLALGAVHHHLIKVKLRTSADLIVETGEARDSMHMALLVGFGAKAVNPYMAFASIWDMIENQKYLKNPINTEEAVANYINAICDGLLKIISRMGISTLQSYCGAQIFEAVGINLKTIDDYFTGTSAAISGIGLGGISEEVLARQNFAYSKFGELNKGGEIFWNREGEHHALNPEVVNKLRKACIENSSVSYKEYARQANEQDGRTTTIRSLLKFNGRGSVPLEEVEAAADILKRFRISAMSFGSISIEAHETIAAAANRIGAASNCGEGGENPSRYNTGINGDNVKSAVKQVASGRFGVTLNYLVNCNEIEIKMAQGAKPGEGGHLPGFKVTPEIAKVRHSALDIDLISPPPHHDIYSIEDLAQLVFDLKNVNPKARIIVKLVSQTGIGAVAAGVAKAHADAVLISGHDGGTGAAPISSIRHVGLPWELGLAEAQQTLLLNNLRGRITLQVDGKIKTGRDVVIAALLGAEEYGFATAALISIGCRMCRKCHLNKCPSGIATQEKVLRNNFNGKPEHLISYLNFVAEEVREIMSQLGFRTMDEMIGRVDVLQAKQSDRDKTKNFDLSPILYRPELPSRIAGRRVISQDHQITYILDRKLIEGSKAALEEGVRVQHFMGITNTDRSFGAMLSGEIAKRYGDNGLPEDTIKIYLQGSAGQSFGAFAARGLTMKLEGEANDYLGKGLSGGKIILTPPAKSTFDPGENIIAGNTILYGATSGEAYISGRVGQRFCVRNSGAIAVVEGIGDHGCEYMTGGTVVILGKTGNNFGAGMSGGVAYVLDEEGSFAARCNEEMEGMENLRAAKDIELVKELIQRHYEYTKSKKAGTILAQWNRYAGRFIKICSPHYQKYLEGID